jgi:two-component system LytT family sensor kinase
MRQTPDDRGRSVVRTAVGWTLYGAFWIAFGLLIALNDHLFTPADGQIAYKNLAVREITVAFVYALFAVPIVVLVRRFPLFGPGWMRGVMVHSAGLLLFCAVTTGVFFLSDRLVRLGSGVAVFDLVRGVEMAKLFSRVQFHVVLYLLIIVAGHGVDYYRRYHREQREVERLEASVARSELESLRLHIHPHFLMNMLATIASRLQDDPDRALTLITSLKELLRNHLEDLGSRLVLLKREVDFLRHYVSLMETHLHGMLEFTWDVDGLSMDAMVPNLLLEPLVENAIRHGRARPPEPTRIRLRCRKVKGTLIIEIRDNGPGFHESQERIVRRGRGVANTARRLSHLYGARHRFSLQNAPEGGAIVTIEIPLVSRGARSQTFLIRARNH